MIGPSCVIFGALFVGAVGFFFGYVAARMGREDVELELRILKRRHRAMRAAILKALAEGESRKDEGEQARAEAGGRPDMG